MTNELKFLPLTGSLAEGRTSDIELNGQDIGYIEVEARDVSGACQRSGSKLEVAGYYVRMGEGYPSTDTLFATIALARAFVRESLK